MVVTDLESKLYGDYLNGEMGVKRDAVFGSDGLVSAPTDFDSRFDTKRLSAIVSGPLIRDRVWFVASYQHIRTLIASSGY